MNTKQTNFLLTTLVTCGVFWSPSMAAMENSQPTNNTPNQERIQQTEVQDQFQFNVPEVDSTEQQPYNATMSYATEKKPYTDENTDENIAQPKGGRVLTQIQCLSNTNQQAQNIENNEHNKQLERKRPQKHLIQQYLQFGTPQRAQISCINSILQRHAVTRRQNQSHDIASTMYAEETVDRTGTEAEAASALVELSQRPQQQNTATTTMQVSRDTTKVARQPKRKRRRKESQKTQTRDSRPTTTTTTTTTTTKPVNKMAIAHLLQCESNQDHCELTFAPADGLLPESESNNTHNEDPGVIATSSIPTNVSSSTETAIEEIFARFNQQICTATKEALERFNQTLLQQNSESQRLLERK